MYSGYHSDTMVNNIFAYGLDGKVYFFGQLTFLVAGMMDLLWPIFCHTSVATLACAKCELIRGFPEVVMQHTL